jgi:Cu/Ag efflux protein CusF
MLRALAACLASLVLASTVSAADKEIRGKLVTLDAENKRITISEQGKHVVYTLNAKELTVTVNEKPSPAGLKDKALVRGADITLVVPEPGKLVCQIIIGPRKVAATEPAKNGNAHTAKAKSEAHATSATVVKVSVEAKTLTVKYDGKVVDLLIGDATKFVGPKGGKRGSGPAGLKDTALKEGAEIQFVAGKDGQAVEEIRLPYRSK